MNFPSWDDQVKQSRTQPARGRPAPKAAPPPNPEPPREDDRLMEVLERIARSTGRTSRRLILVELVAFVWLLSSVAGFLLWLMEAIAKLPPAP